MAKKEEYIKRQIEHILNALGVSTSFSISEDTDQYTVAITGDELNFLIGHKGETLNALQHFLSLALFREFDGWVTVFIDINDYRAKRREKLEEIAKSHIDRVRFFQKPVELPPMNSYERKMVHEFVSGYEDIVTESVGEGVDRHIILKLA